MTKEETSWYEDDVEESVSYAFKEYDVTSTPNDFNTKTIIDFIESGLFKIPGFQRNYVWDLKRASKLIESIIIGLPVPQVFLYEESRNNYLVIDGQQRLLTIYFFSKRRFPKLSKRLELREIFEEYNRFPEETLYDDNYFDDFNLQLSEPSVANPLHKLNYATLGDKRHEFDLRTIRNIVIKQNFPDGEDSAMFEIFNRLNSGGVILKPQEIRTSLYHSSFYNQLYKLNLYSPWRRLLNKNVPDLHMKDVEILLRGFGLLLKYKDYKPSMTQFLNGFSKESKVFKSDSLEYFKQLFKVFCDYVIELDESIFISKNRNFSITIFESIFVALCEQALNEKSLNVKQTSLEKITELKENAEFILATQLSTASKSNVQLRVNLAKEIL